MTQDLLLGIILLTSVLLLGRLLGAWAHRPRKRSSRNQRKKSISASHGPYEAVSCEGNCEALRFMRGRRFLMREAPKLPVHGCNATQCHCRYVHHQDRRSGGDRRGVHGLHSELFEYSGSKERRSDARYGRRRSDFAYG